VSNIDPGRLTKTITPRIAAIGCRVMLGHKPYFASRLPFGCLFNGLSGGGRASPLRGLGRNSTATAIFRRTLTRPLHREAK
jgi:hypothetical protein